MVLHLPFPPLCGDLCVLCSFSIMSNLALIERGGNSDHDPTVLTNVKCNIKFNYKWIKKTINIFLNCSLIHKNVCCFFLKKKVDSFPITAYPVMVSSSTMKIN